MGRNFALQCTKALLSPVLLRTLWTVGLFVTVLTGFGALAETSDKRVFFGDLHVHTQLSMEAFLLGSRTSPDAAYRFAKGEPVEAVSGLTTRLDRPLDFYAVTDHAKNLQLRGAWQQIIDAAQTHNEPGKLTTFVGFEYTSFRDSADFHRNIIFQNAKVSDRPYSGLDSLNPEDLWLWMDELRATGIESLAIPHSPPNSANGSNDRDAAYTAQRQRNEPLIDLTQRGDARDAPKDGLLYGTSGLTGVWAEENSRAAIYAAFRRKETFATSGTRIQVRMFAGFRFARDLHNSDQMTAKALKQGVAMGGDLSRGRGPLMISVVARQDAQAAPLQRLQVVKGWVEDGRSTEKVFDVACAAGAGIDAATQRCPDSKATVELATCELRGPPATAVAAEGATELATTWSDPEFRRDQAAFYYVRVIENPSCRRSTWDAMRAGRKPRAELSATVQEQAYTSPVWYSPNQK